MLVTHVAVSVGWLGGAYGMIILAVVAMTTKDPGLRHNAYVLMHINDPALMYPCSLGVVATGLTVSLGTDWGLLRYYWVFAKSILTLVVMLLGAMFVSQNVKVAMVLTAHHQGADLHKLGLEIIAGSFAMICILMVNTVLSVFKPWGRTKRGRRAAQRRTRVQSEARARTRLEARAGD